MASLIKSIISQTGKSYVIAPRLFNSARNYTSTANSLDNDEPVQITNPFQKEKIKCILCEMNITPDYKNVRLLSQFQSPYTGRIYARHVTGLCKHKQEQIEKEIIKAQGCGIMPTYHKNVEFLKDPKLFDPERPVRSHKY